jgi:hypothetical protein
MNYQDDLAPLYDIINIVFQDKIEVELDALRIKYKETFLINNSSREEFDALIKSNSLSIYSYLSDSYVKHTLSKYFSNNGIVFLILTTVSVKAKLYYSNLG